MFRFTRSFRPTLSCFLWLIWLWCSVLPLAAQYHFDQWTTAQGLPHNNITAIAQTRDGYLWLGTADGLARFDGVRFTVFNTVNTPGFSSNRINRLFEDRSGVLWIGTDENGLMRYAERRFTPDNDGLPDNRILRIDEDDTGALWVYTETGIARRQGKRFHLLTGAPWDAFHPSRQTLDNVRLGPWYVDAQGLHRLAWGRVTTLDSTAFGADPRALKITFCQENPPGTLWITTAQRRFYRYQNGQLTRLDSTSPIGYPKLADRQGGTWFYEHPGTVGRLTTTGFQEYHLPKPPNVMLNPTFFADREGTLWLTSTYGGLFRARPQVITSVASPGIASYALYQDRRQTVWLTHYLQYANGQFKLDTALQQRFTERTTAALEDGTGTMLFGTEKGLLRLTEGRVVVESNVPGVVSALHRDTTGVLWAGTGQGLYRVEPAPLTRFTRQDGLAAEDIRVIISRRAGGLWIGGYGGLTQYHNERFTAVPLTGLHSDRIRSLYEDEDGVLWIGTYDGGLGRLHNGKLTSYTTLNGLYNDGVFQILPDQLGYFWMSSNRGIYRVRKAELNDFAAGRARSIHCTNFNQADGMRNEECNGGRQPAGFVAADGKLWFATQEGAAVVDPAAVPNNPQPPPVVIETCRVDNEAMAFEPGLRLEPGQSNLEIQYTGLSLIKSERMQFRYRLLGLDNNWTEAGARRTAYFTHLPPGAYTFQVIAANSDGVWNNEGAILRLTVMPPFYRTWWFRIVFLCGLIGVGVAAYRTRIAQLTRRERQQEAFARQLMTSQEAERQRIAAELHDGLGQNLIIIKNWATLGLSQTDAQAPVREQLDEIADTAVQSLNEVRTIIHNLRPYQLDSLGLSKALEAMLKQVATASGIAFMTDIAPLAGVFTAADEIVFYRIVQECVNNIIKHAQATEATVLVEREGATLHITIEDNGRGFVNAEFGMRNAEATNNSQSATHTPQSSGFGLKGLEERVRMLHGTLTMRSVPGKGTQISMMIPVPKHD